jgi:uncharacterized protein with HEPN domain
MSADDLIRLRHMLEAPQTALNFMKDENRDSLNTDQKLVFAVVRAVEIVGEAASKLTKDFRDKNPQVPWAAIVGMRNRLIHAYFDVDLDQVWSAITVDLPILITELENIIHRDNP